MAKYDAMGDRVKRRVPIAVWVMILGIITATVGLIWCVNTDLKKYAKTENLYTDQNVDEVTELEFDFDYATTEISRSSDDQIHVSIENAPKGIYKYGQKDGKFYIHRKKFFSLFSISGVGIKHIPFLNEIYPEAIIKVELPDKVFEKAEIDNCSGDLKIDSLNCEKFILDTGFGNTELTNCSAKKTDIENGVGETKIRSCTFSDTKLDNDVGEITVKNCTFKGDTEIDNGVGSTTINAEFKGDIDIDNGVGDITLNIDSDGSEFKITGDDDNVSVRGKSSSKDPDYKIKIDNCIGDIDITFVS